MIASEERRNEIAARLEEIVFAEIRPLLDEAMELCRESGVTYMANAEAYVFEQIDEHLENCNPHNQSLNSLATEIREGKNDAADYEEG
jgi:hypothetical protein